ncbi:Cysteine-rich and transmembrane domain-containing protein 1 [Morella rubra]|uniref:Cysteine-rich and transmembrane domain-containing protein 1 n=1 Tax=Morella rubra TaxID=262757 RepID=A0A6A1VPU1_9ROSI|nr:Cysteine-rich and transmembrane domain-containing protein 1 [Morella rubra]
MGSAEPVRIFARILLLLLLVIPVLSSNASAGEHSLDVAQSTRLQLSSGLPVKNSPGLKPGASIVSERVHIHGLSRLKNLEKFARLLKVNVSQKDPNIRLPNFEVCFHRNMSLGIGMCPQGQWEKVAKGSWVRSMSPFDYRLLDIRTTGSSLENFEVSIEEEFFLYRVICLILGVILMSLASSLSKSLVFYYGSAISVGVILVILMILFQGMKLLPTGRKNSLAIFIYSSAVGLGSFLLRYLPGLFRAILSEIGISEDMYNPLAIFLLAFVVLTGAWMGFWAVRKLVLTENGSIDISTSYFVAWSIRILAGIMILQSSADPLLAAEALISGIMVSSLLRRICRLRFLRRLYKYDSTILELINYLPSSGFQDLLPFRPIRNMVKSPKKNRKRSQIPGSSPLGDSHNEYTYKVQGDDTSKLIKPRTKSFTLAPCDSADRGFSRLSPCQLSDSELYPSTFHATPERRKFSKAEWEMFTRDSTEQAVEELVSSPDFSKWLIDNAERITVNPSKGRAEQHHSQQTLSSKTVLRLLGHVLSYHYQQQPLMGYYYQHQPPIGVPPPQVMSYYNQQQTPIGVPPPQGYPKDSYPPPGYPVQGYPPPGYPPQQYAPQYAPPPRQETGFLEGCCNLDVGDKACVIELVVNSSIMYSVHDFRHLTFCSCYIFSAAKRYAD